MTNCTSKKLQMVSPTSTLAKTITNDYTTTRHNTVSLVIIAM